MPCLRAQATIRRASSPAFTEPRPTSPSRVTPASASSRKSASVMPFSSTGAPASTFTPPGRKLWNARCAVIASAFRPTMSFGRPGRCTSPAEIMVVTPPLSVESIQPSWFCRGVQSPNTGCTWLSIRPGARHTPLASISVSGRAVSQSFCLPTWVIRPSIATTVSASRIGRSRSPDSNRPTLRTTSLPLGGATGSSAIGHGTISHTYCIAGRRLCRIVAGVSARTPAVRILLIEDDTDIAANLYDYLESKGHHVDAAADGITGLHLAVTHDFDAVVLDLALPGLSGLQV